MITISRTNSLNRYEVSGDDLIVTTSSGKTFVVDKQDKEVVMSYTWCVSGNGYVMSRTAPDCRHTILHRLLTGASNGQFVDHINGNPLDNRRRNLRLCLKQQNEFNTKIRIDNTSGFRGVCLGKCGRYRAYITKDGKQHHLGEYKDPKEAAAAYNRAAEDLFGEYARLNNID